MDLQMNVHMGERVDNEYMGGKRTERRVKQQIA